MGSLGPRAQYAVGRGDRPCMAGSDVRRGSRNGSGGGSDINVHLRTTGSRVLLVRICRAWCDGDAALVLSFIGLSAWLDSLGGDIHEDSPRSVSCLCRTSRVARELCRPCRAQESGASKTLSGRAYRQPWRVDRDHTICGWRKWRRWQWRW